MSDLTAFITLVVQDLSALSSDPLVAEVHECRVNDHLVDLPHDRGRGLGQPGQAVAFRLVAGLDVRCLPLDVLGGGDTSDLGIELRTPVAGVDFQRLAVNLPERLEDLQREGLDRITDLEGGNHVDYPFAFGRFAGLELSVAEILTYRPHR